VAREATVRQVREAIRRGFADATGDPPTNQELIESAGVAPATFYRVLQQHEDVALLLDGARTGHELGRRSGAAAPDGELDQVVAELREVIAVLVHDNRQLRRRLAALDPGGATTTSAPTVLTTTEVTLAEVPATEVPAAEVPAAPTPTAEVPATEVPAAEMPAAQVPAAEVPAAEVPATEVPRSDTHPAPGDDLASPSPPGPD
jgi:hypothetical protein